MDLGKGAMMVYDLETEKVRHFSKNLMCPSTGISYPEPEPNLFSFNSPYGVCPTCNGLGVVSEVDRKKIIPDDKKSIRKGGIAPLGAYKNNWVFRQIEGLLQKYEYDLNTPIKEIDDELIDKILNGTNETLKLGGGTGTSEYSVNFEGIVNFIARQADESASKPILRWARSFMNQVECPTCHGSRLRKEALFFRLDEKNISEVTAMDIDRFDDWINQLEEKMSERKMVIAKEILKEIKSRSGFLRDVGLNYLSLNRSAKTLSGGEAQRIRLATQIGSQLVGVLYILDEPSIGLHQRDNHKLIDSLVQLKDLGNSVIVVEHDKDMILAADYVLDIGPKAGVHGGKVVAEGTVEEIKKADSLTADYLTGKREIPLPEKSRKGIGKKIAEGIEYMLYYLKDGKKSQQHTQDLIKSEKAFSEDWVWSFA
jgi:excinuclease ABC subunit A